MYNESNQVLAFFGLSVRLVSYYVQLTRWKTVLGMQPASHRSRSAHLTAQNMSHFHSSLPR